MAGRRILLWSFGATTLLTTIMQASTGLGLSRMDIPFMLGTMVTPSHDRARMVGFGMHFVNGWLFARVYGAMFSSLGTSSTFLGAVIGLFHGLFVLVAAMPALPGLHPRMASETSGPTPTGQLEPPGFLALNYGFRTPLVTLLAHIVFGAMLGAFAYGRIELPRIFAAGRVRGPKDRIAYRLVQAAASLKLIGATLSSAVRRDSGANARLLRRMNGRWPSVRRLLARA